MPTQPSKSEQYDAADAFYGQSERVFDEQLRLLGALDPRLIRAFKRTRERYIKQRGDSQQPAT